MKRSIRPTMSAATVAACLFAVAPTIIAQDSIVKKGSISIGVQEFETKPSTLYLVEATGDGFRPQLDLKDGRLSAGRFDFRNRNKSTASFFSAEAKTRTLYITVDGFNLKGKNPFNYTLKLTPVTLQAKPLLNIKASLTDQDPPVKIGFINHKHHKQYKIKMTAGKTYVIDMMKRNQAFLDCYLYLTDNNGKMVKQDDDGGEGLNSRIVIQPKTTGEYNIVATGLGKALGDFTLTVRGTK